MTRLVRPGEDTESWHQLLKQDLNRIICALSGNYKNINDESSMFDEIKPLFVSAVQNNSEEE